VVRVTEPYSRILGFLHRASNHMQEHFLNEKRFAIEARNKMTEFAIESLCYILYEVASHEPSLNQRNKRMSAYQGQFYVLLAQLM
jgi:hypothetical protein